MTNHPDHVNRPEAAQSPTTLRVGTVSGVLMISHSNRSNGDAKNGAAEEKKEDEQNKNVLRIFHFS